MKLSAPLQTIIVVVNFRIVQGSSPTQSFDVLSETALPHLESTTNRVAQHLIGQFIKCLIHEAMLVP